MDMLSFLGQTASSSPPIIAALLIGMITSISPCPLGANIAAVAFLTKKAESKAKAALNSLSYALGRATSYVVIAALGTVFGVAIGSALTPLQIIDLHTYPNPYVESRNRTDGIRYAAADVIAGAGENVSIEIKIYDIRGSLVTTLSGNINESDTHENNAHTLYKWRPVVNASGRPLASGVYMYYLTAKSASNYQVTQKGKLSIVR